MRILLFLSLFCGLTVRAQDSTSNWVLLKEYPLVEDAIWNVDILQNVYIVHDRMIMKYDSSGVKKFSQSIKSIGQVKEIMPINTMKLVLFSEDQQVLCMLDNTLTMTEDLIDLSEFNIVNASLATTSSQSEKIWILDQLNSRLLLLDLAGKMQFQEVRNLKGVLNASGITSMIESNGHLFLLNDNYSFYEFDMYGTLVNAIGSAEESMASKSHLFPSENKIFWLSDNRLYATDYEGYTTIVTLPKEGFLEFKKVGDIYYFRTADKILKYAFKNAR